MEKRIITINRMFGSNGRLIGKTLAENLDIGFYDKELIDMAAKKNNIPFDTLAKVDEKKASQWVFPVDSELQFTDSKWLDMTQYDLCIDSSRFSMEQIVEIVKRCL